MCLHRVTPAGRSGGGGGVCTDPIRKGDSSTADEMKDGKRRQEGDFPRHTILRSTTP